MTISNIYKYALLIVLTSCITALDTQAQNVPSVDIQIAGALSPAPGNLKAEASVLGFNNSGEMIQLREGTNGFICLADNPMDERFHASCYHESLEPFMARGRELRKEGKNRDENRAVRMAEIERGTLTMPEQPAALYQLFGPKDIFNLETGTVEGASPLYVMYIPYATTESTGLSSEPLMPGGPWLMDAGKPWAHIMYSPGQAN